MVQAILLNTQSDRFHTVHAYTSTHTGFFLFLFGARGGYEYRQTIRLHRDLRAQRK